MSAYQTASVVYNIQNSTLFGHGLFGNCYSNIVGTAATMFFSTQYQPVIMSVVGSIIVGLSGLFPLLVLPVDDSISLKTGRKYSSPTMHCNKVNTNVRY
jgi:zinc transporter 13